MIGMIGDSDLGNKVPGVICQIQFLFKIAFMLQLQCNDCYLRQ